MALHMKAAQAEEAYEGGGIAPITNKDVPKRSRRGLAAAAGVVAALAVAYGVGAYHYQSHFLPNTTVGGVDASGLTAPELAEQAELALASYENHVSGDGLDFTVTAADAGLSLDGDALATEALERQNALLWPLALMHKTTVEPTQGIQLDEGLLAQKVSSEVEAFNEGAEPPTDAAASYDTDQQAFVVVPAALGTAVDPESASAVALEAVRALKPATVLGEDQLARASVTEDDESLLAAVERANAIVGLSVPLTLEGKTLYTVTPDLISGWVSLARTDEGFDVSVDQEAIRKWSYDNLNDVVNGSDETRTWEVLSSGVARELAPRLASANGEAMEIPIIVTATRPAESKGHESRGRHIDVNLETQYARLYADDGTTVLWRSPIVSGNLAWSHDTPEGEFQILNMEEGVTLTGLNDGVELEPGEEPKPEDYYNSYVNYWMSFIGDAVGLHDATWRYDDEFGGDTYMWNGSHGCVNLPYEQAKELYGLVHVGDKVYVHK